MIKVVLKVNFVFQADIVTYLDAAFDELPTTLQSLNLLVTFERLNLQNLNVADKFNVLLHRLEDDIHRISQVSRA